METSNFESLCRKLEVEMVELTKTAYNGSIQITEFWEGFDHEDNSEQAVVAEVMDVTQPYCEFIYWRPNHGSNSLAIHPGPVVQGIQLLWVHDPTFQEEERNLIPADARVLFALLAIH